MPLTTIDFTKNSPFTLIQEDKPQNFLGYVFGQIGLRVFRSKQCFAFILANGVGGFFKIMVWDKPEIIQAIASVYQIVKVYQAIAKYEDSFEDETLPGLSIFELHVYEASQLTFFGSLLESEIENVQRYRLYIENEDH